MTLDRNVQQVFIPERYVLHLDLLVKTKDYGMGVMIPAAELQEYISSNRVHANVILNHDVVYVLRETAATPIEFMINKGVR